MHEGLVVYRYDLNKARQYKVHARRQRNFVQVYAAYMVDIMHVAMHECAWLYPNLCATKRKHMLFDDQRV